MATIDVTEATFAEVVDTHEIVILDFWASWCGPCRAFAPVFEGISQNHADIAFGKVNTEVERNLAGYFGIRAIPTLMVLRDGVVLLNEPGALSAAALEELIQEVREVDMDDVRRQIEAEQEDDDEDDEDDD